MSINWAETIKLYNISEIELKEYFDKYPGSNKKVVVSCDNPKCKNFDRIVVYQMRRSLCRMCAQKKRFEDLLEHEKYSRSQKKRYENPEERKKTSEVMIKTHIDDPTISERKAKSQKIRWENPEEHRKTAKSVKNFYDTLDDPGQQIVRHHYIYDESDLSKYTMEMTRSKHMKIHQAMRKEKIEIPHINIMKEV
jgi:hypothetical protein